MPEFVREDDRLVEAFGAGFVSFAWNDIDVWETVKRLPTEKFKYAHIGTRVEEACHTARLTAQISERESHSE